MTDEQTNRFEMAQTTLGVLDRYRAVWEATPDTADDRDRLAALVDAVRDAAQRQADPTTAATAVKDELREAVRSRVYTLAGALRSWALRRSMTALADRVDVTSSELRALRDAALAERSEIVVAAAREHLDGDDGLAARTAVTTEAVDELDALDDQFAEELGTPRAAIIAKSRATAQIAEALSAAHRLLTDHLDPSVRLYADAAPDFARDYEAARTVVDRGGTRQPSDGEAS